MRQVMALLAFGFFLTPAIFADEPLSPDGTPLRYQGGLMIVRQGNQTFASAGGVIFPRFVRVKTRTPEGPVITRFVMPSLNRDPNAPFFTDAVPGWLTVEVPDNYTLLFVDGQLTESRGTVRQLESPPLPPDQAFTLNLRTAIRSGDKVLIEDKQVVMRSRERAVVKFDGSQTFAIPNPSRE